MRLVLDTNIVAAGLLWQGPPNRLIEQAFDGQIELATTPALLIELEGVLQRAKFAHQVAKQSLSIAGLVLRYAELAQLVQPASIAQSCLPTPTTTTCSLARWPRKPICSSRVTPICSSSKRIRASQSSRPRRRLSVSRSAKK